MKIDLYDDNIGCVEYVQHMGEDLTIVNAARVSFGKQKNVVDEKDKKLINYLIKHQHTSTLEHNVITFRFTVPMYVRSQHHRHRTWSYNEISRRYTEENLRFYEPKMFRTQHKSNRQASNVTDEINPDMATPSTGLVPNSTYLASQAVNDHHRTSVKLYENLLVKEVCREQARGVLPQNLYTEYYGTCNLNNLIKFINLRTHEGAQWEIQRVATACLTIAESLWPIAVSSFRSQKKL
jgi:thymidylate synthase (FAD)